MAERPDERHPDAGALLAALEAEVPEARPSRLPPPTPPPAPVSEGPERPSAEPARPSEPGERTTLHRPEAPGLGVAWMAGLAFVALVVAFVGAWVLRATR